MIVFIGMLLEKVSALALRFRNRYLIYKMPQAGKNVHIDGRVSICARKIRCGNNVFIGGGAMFVSSDAEICIGDNVMFGPNVMIATGNHRIDVVGKHMIDVKEKREQDDKDVVIEDDVWIGMGVTILKGVTIGKGSVIGAGTIITRDVPPYSVVYTDSHINMKPRFTEEEILEHEKLLNGEN